MDRGDTSIHQQIKKSGYNAYFIELACLVRIEKYCSRLFFWLVYGPSRWRDPQT